MAELAALRATDVHDAWQLLLAQARHDQSVAGPQWSPQRVAEVEFFTEIAMLTHRTEYRARTLADTAIALVSKLPASFAVLAAGQMSEEHAAVIAAHSDELEGEALERYDCRMARLAPGLTDKQLEYRARAHAQTAQPETVIERVEKAVKTRRVTVDPAKDGMAYLTLFAPAPEVYAIANRAMSLAKGLKVGGDPRSITQLRVDVLSDLLLNGETSIPGATRGTRGRIHVMVPAMTLLGVGEEPAILRGYGPIDAVTADDDNLAPLAPAHHRVKHHTRWQIEQGENNLLIWTSPAGLRYFFEPQGMMRAAPKVLIEAAEENVRLEATSEQPCPF